MRKIVIAGNWKMYKNRQEAKAFLSAFLPKLQDRAKSDTNFPLVAIFAPFTQLQTLAETSTNFSNYVKIGAQNVHWADEGAFTGEISAPMLQDLGIKYVIVGHSERRQYFGETDETVNKRLKAAQQHGLTPILCVGESKQQRDAGEIEAVIINQLKHGLVGIDQHNLIIAYEPIWAIGTGDTCEVSEANRVIGIIRQQLTNPDVTIQYGGSVKPDNIDEIMSQSEIDGALVGGASLDVESFTRIINYQSI